MPDALKIAICEDEPDQKNMLLKIHLLFLQTGRICLLILSKESMILFLWTSIWKASLQALTR